MQTEVAFLSQSRGVRTRRTDVCQVWNLSSTQSIPGLVQITYHGVKYGTEALEANQPPLEKEAETKTFEEPGFPQR